MSFFFYDFPAFPLDLRREGRRESRSVHYKGSDRGYHCQHEASHDGEFDGHYRRSQCGKSFSSCHSCASNAGPETLLRVEAQAGIQGSSHTSGRQPNPGLHCHGSLGTVTWSIGRNRNCSQGQFLPPFFLSAGCRSRTCGAGLPEVHLCFGSLLCSERRGSVQGSLCRRGMVCGLSLSVDCLVASKLVLACLLFRLP